MTSAAASASSSFGTAASSPNSKVKMNKDERRAEYVDVIFMLFFFVVEIIMIPFVKYAPQLKSESIKLKKLPLSLPSKMIYFALAVETFMVRRELV